ncbi:MAG: hypothetical protein LUC41_01405 [Clostridiales bacterium]|nr:hypothetical protein [Clostridiales bacterium]
MYEEYYNEPDPVKRKAVLDAMPADGDDAKLVAQMKKLFEIRYTPHPKIGYADNFVRCFLNLKMAAENLDSQFARRRVRKQVLQAIHELCLDRTDEFSEWILYREMCHLTAVYISGCQGDKHYNSVIWGVGFVSDERQKKRLNLDMDRVGEAIPKYLDLEEEYAIMKRAVLATRKVMIR